MLKRVAPLSALLLFDAVKSACVPAAAAVVAPAPTALALVPVIVAFVTPEPTPTLSPSPTPSPEPTGRALRAWQLNEKQRAYLMAHPPADGDFETAMSYLTIDPDKKIIALTFDDGPSKQNTNRIFRCAGEIPRESYFFLSSVNAFRVTPMKSLARFPLVAKSEAIPGGIAIL